MRPYLCVSALNLPEQCQSPISEFSLPLDLVCGRGRREGRARAQKLQVAQNQLVVRFKRAGALEKLQRLVTVTAREVGAGGLDHETRLFGKFFHHQQAVREQVFVGN